MDKTKHQNYNLLFFLNAIMGSVLDSLEGSFQKTAKYKFGKVINCVNGLERELVGNLTDTAHETYADSVQAVSEILNIAISEYNAGDIGKFLEYVKNYKK